MPCQYQKKVNSFIALVIYFLELTSKHKGRRNRYLKFVLF